VCSAHYRREREHNIRVCLLLFRKLKQYDSHDTKAGARRLYIMLSIEASEEIFQTLGLVPVLVHERYSRADIGDIVPCLLTVTAAVQQGDKTGGDDGATDGSNNNNGNKTKTDSDDDDAYRFCIDAAWQSDVLRALDTYTVVSIWIDELETLDTVLACFRHCHVITLIKIAPDTWQMMQRYERFYHDTLFTLIEDRSTMTQLLRDIATIVNDRHGSVARRLWKYWFRVDDGPIKYPSQFRCLTWVGKPSTKERRQARRRLYAMLDVTLDAIKHSS